ncbi:MAG: gliding motility lipoprotein GldD, partial [Bacteroidetes bacterium]
KKVDNNLPNLIEDAHNLVMKHIPKSSGIDEVRYENRQNKVYGIGFYINGTEAASPYQFFVTDSSHHFLRGALYFNALPNNDSLAPVIKFLKKDIEALIASISWHPPH